MIRLLTKQQINAVVASMKNNDQSKADAQSKQDYENQVLAGKDKLTKAQGDYIDYLEKTTWDATTYRIAQTLERRRQTGKSL